MIQQPTNPDQATQWENVILPAIKDLHKIDVYRQHGGYNALRKALDKFYPSLKNVKLIDYKVRVLSGKEGTGSLVEEGELVEGGEKIRVFLEYAPANSGAYGNTVSIPQSRKVIMNAARFRWDTCSRELLRMFDLVAGGKTGGPGGGE